MKKLGVIGLSVLMGAFAVFSNPGAFAAGNTPEVSVNTNQKKYELREPVTVTAELDNPSGNTLEQVTMSVKPAKGLEVVGDQTLVYDSIDANSSQKAQFTIRSVEKKQRDLAFKNDYVEIDLSKGTFKNSLNYKGNVTYSSYDPSVASVAADGTVTLKKAGMTAIIATAEEDDTYYTASALYILEVTDKEDGDRKEQTIEFEKTYIAKWKEDKKFTNPLKNKGKGSGTISYYSSNPYVAEVDKETGEVTIHRTGKITISAYKAGDKEYKSTAARYTLEIFNDPVNTGVSTEDDGFGNPGLFIGLGAGAVIIAAAAVLMNKKKAARLLALILVAGMTISMTDSLKAAEQASDTVTITVNGVDYDIEVLCSYEIVTEEDDESTGGSESKKKEPAAPKDVSAQYDVATDMINESRRGGDVTLNMYNRSIQINGSDDQVVSSMMSTIQSDASSYESQVEEANEAFETALNNEQAADYVHVYESEVTYQENNMLSIRRQWQWKMEDDERYGEYGLNFDLTDGSVLRLTDVTDVDEETILERINDEADTDVSDWSIDEFDFYLEDEDVIICFSSDSMGQEAEELVFDRESFDFKQQRTPDIQIESLPSDLVDETPEPETVDEDESMTEEETEETTATEDPAPTDETEGTVDEYTEDIYSEPVTGPDSYE